MLNAFKQVPITALRDLVMDQIRLFATFPELDHYGERKDAEYIGPMLDPINAPRADWPEGEGPRIFACLRPDTSCVKEILEALGAITARVVCVASGFTPMQLEPFRRDHVRYVSGPVDLAPLLDANLCITYGAEGTMMRFLMATVPQLISPWHVETYMAARRIESTGLGSALSSPLSRIALEQRIQRMADDSTMRSRVTAFAARRAKADYSIAAKVNEALSRNTMFEHAQHDSQASSFTNSMTAFA